MVRFTLRAVPALALCLAAACAPARAAEPVFHNPLVLQRADPQQRPGAGSGHPLQRQARPPVPQLPDAARRREPRHRASVAAQPAVEGQVVGARHAEEQQVRIPFVRLEHWRETLGARRI